MNTCATCKHWGDYLRYKRCNRIADADDLPSGSDEKARVCSMDNSGAWLQTAANFGCVLWEVKDGE